MKVKDFRELVESKGFTLVVRNKTNSHYKYNVFYGQLIFLQADTLDEAKSAYNRLIPLFENGTIKSDKVRWVNGITTAFGKNFECLAA